MDEEDRVADCRENARNCIEASKETTNRDTRTLLLDLAFRWSELAYHFEKQDRAEPFGTKFKSVRLRSF